MISVDDYKFPRTTTEALDLLSAGDYLPIAGGTDLIPQLRQGLSMKLLDTCALGLDFIKEENGEIEIGAGATHSMIAAEPLVIDNFPLIARAAGLVGSVQIRNRGTIGGNVVNASPCADTVPALLIYDAEVCLISKKGKRSVNLSDFISGPYTTLKKPDELLYSFKCKPYKNQTGYSFQKLGRRQAVNISRMTLAVSLAVKENKIEEARISGGSVFPTPARMEQLEKTLISQSISERLFDEVAVLAGDLMIRKSGQRWSTPYKKPVLIGLVKRALTEASRSKAD